MVGFSRIQRSSNFSRLLTFGRKNDRNASQFPTAPPKYPGVISTKTNLYLHAPQHIARTRPNPRADTPRPNPYPSFPSLTYTAACQIRSMPPHLPLPAGNSPRRSPPCHATPPHPISTPPHPPPGHCPSLPCDARAEPLPDQGRGGREVELSSNKRKDFHVHVADPCRQPRPCRVAAAGSRCR